MTEKKHAINISLIMIIISLIITFIFWSSKDNVISSLIFTLSTGVFGSSFATLWIFVYEYNREKNKVLMSVFFEVNELMDKSALCWMDRVGLYDSGIKENMKNKYYIPPSKPDIVTRMDKQEKCLYCFSRFIDGLSDLGYDRIQRTINTIDQIDFWSDTFNYRVKLSRVVKDKLSIPIYDVFVTAPAMEDGYIFRYCDQFKNNYSSDAFELYSIVEKLDKVMHGSDMNAEYSWLKKSPNMQCYMHEKLWMFRDAFDTKHRSIEERKQALRAFLYEEEYPYIR